MTAPATGPSTPPATAPSQHAARRGTIPYEPALDGLRGIAMIAIAGFHADIPWLSGSFLALDVFFVLSGYLITRLMLAEWSARGRLDLRAFWERRARRLLPAMLLTLCGIAAYSAFFAAPAELSRIRGDALSTLFYFNNWWQIFRGHSYFDAYAGVSPLHHAWSLSLEEQWYVAWPIFVGLFLARTRSAGRLGWACLGLAALSALYMAWLYVPGSDPSRVYYGTDTRAHEILIGAALACAMHLGRVPLLDRPRLWSGFGLLAGLGLGVLWAIASHAEPWVYQGGMAVVSLLTAIVIVGASQPAPNALRTIVGLTPFRWLGMISYGFYLWHLPVYLVVTRTETGLEGLPLFGLRLGVTLVIACFSYFVLERPVRRGVLTPRHALGAAIAGSLAVAMLNVGTTRDVVDDASLLAAARAQTPALAGLDPALRHRVRPLRVLLVGDSVAWSLGNGFVPSVESATGIELINGSMPGCGLAYGRLREHGKISVRSSGMDCEHWDLHWRRYVEETDPDVAVLLSGGWDVFDREVEDVWVAYGSPAYDEHLRGLFRRASNVLGEAGIPVVHLTSAYFHRENRASAMKPVVSERWRIDRYNDLLREHAASTTQAGVFVLEFGEWVCGDAACTATRDGVPLRSDGSHFSHEGAKRAAAWLAPRLHAIVREQEASAG